DRVRRQVASEARNLIAQRAPGRAGAMQRSRAAPAEGRPRRPDRWGNCNKNDPVPPGTGSWGFGSAARGFEGLLDGGAPLAELGQGLFEDGLAVLVAAAFFHVRQVRLVRLGLRRGRGVLRVLSGGEPAARTVPGLGDLDVRREAGAGLVPVGAVERHPDAGGGFAALRLTHRTGSDTAAPNRVATTHGVLLAQCCRRRPWSRPGGAALAWCQTGGSDGAVALEQQSEHDDGREP